MIRLLAILIAAGVLGNWFMVENKKNRMRGGPWYGPYVSIPGLIIIAAILGLPLLVMFLKP